MIKSPPEYIQLRKRAASSDRIPNFSIQDRTIDDQHFMLFEINQGTFMIFHRIKYFIKSIFSDGTDLRSPRVFKIYPNTTYVGRDAKSAIGKQYFYVNSLL